MSEVGSPAPDPVAERQRAIDECVLAGSHLNVWLTRTSPDHPPLSASMADGLRHFGASTAGFDLWMGCRGIERLRLADDTWRKHVGQAPTEPPEIRSEPQRRLI